MGKARHKGFWTCQRVKAGRKCGFKNPNRKRICEACSKTRPIKKRPAHMAALDLDYEGYAALNGGETCGICGATQKKGGPRLHRDHDHRTGTPRGLLCWPCNSALRVRVTAEWCRAAAEYLDRAAARNITTNKEA